ncbi:MAG TPA: GAF domain-containing protein, partial [Candidatus Methylomirabilis sp.]|nr:GAF domain-containing protein [Candidatus Methylomirabilis sp.]
MAKWSQVSFETRFPISSDRTGFPFKCELSLAPLIAAWSKAASGDQKIVAKFHRHVLEEVQKVPELLEPIEDVSVLTGHRELLNVLMTHVFPPASWAEGYAAAIFPFQFRTFYASPAFERLFSESDGMVRGRINLDAPILTKARILNAYTLILRKYYGVGLGFDYPIILTTEDARTRLERHFRLHFDRQFLEVEAIGTNTPLTDDERQRILANRADPNVLMAIIPPNQFVFRGFGLLKATDITDQEVLSSLKRDLIDKESIVSPVHFRRLQAELCTLLGLPDLRLGLAAVRGEQVFSLNYGCQLEHSCIFADSVHRSLRDFAGSIYDRAVQQGHPVIIEDLAAWPGRTAIDEALLATGARSVVVAPLFYQDRLIGTLELASPHPGDLDAMNTMKLREVLPIFSMAVRRSLDELNSRVDALIKANCTAIHPSVEWRFRQAALQSIERRTRGGGTEMEPIVFRDVFPLYAAADIRGSSTQRHLAIQADLIAHLRLARELVQAARGAKALPILDELGYRIDSRIRQVELAMNSGDELTMIAFLRQHVESLFDHLDGFGPSVRDRIEAYRLALDPLAGTVYRRRKEYEESVTLINDTISSYLDAEQQAAQAMYPHYFEKQVTDGLDYTIYVGETLMENGSFNELYLKNLRLWQLMVGCGIARRTQAVLSTLPVPLETTQLILAQHAPLAIRFRYEEKRFDVDGAYNVRYEVIKKRIDKAVVRGTSERATQPGKIAIIYSQPAEASEYRDYVDYLQSVGYLTGELEDLELETLQGVHGLRAL